MSNMRAHTDRDLWAIWRWRVNLRDTWRGCYPLLSSLKRSNCLLYWVALIEYSVEDTSFIHYSSFSIIENSFEFLNHLITFHIRETRQHYIYALFAKTCVCHDSDLIFRFILNPLSTKTSVFDLLHEEECRWARPWPSASLVTAWMRKGQLPFTLFLIYKDISCHINAPPSHTKVTQTNQKKIKELW